MSKINYLRLFCAALMFALCFVIGAQKTWAQSQASTGQIVGSVRDANGATIANATVKVVNTKTGLEQTTTTNEDGLYRFVLLPPSTYEISAEAKGFAKTTLSNVIVAVGQTADINLTLGVGGVSEAITVSADAIQTTTSQPDALFNQAAINNLPINGRRFQDFVQLTPMALIEPSRNQISLSGQRGINSNINIDGADYNQPFFGGIRGGERSNNAYTIPQEAIQEFQVVASGYTPEFGRSTGGIVNVLTKSGTNGYHGSGFYLHRDKAFSRNTDYFQAFEADLRARGINQEVVPAPTQQQWGASIGGPIKRDRMFFFGAYEQQRVRQGRAVYFSALRQLNSSQVAGLSPNSRGAYDNYLSLEEPFDQTNDAITVLGRFDYQISSNHRFNVRYNYSNNEGLNANATGDSPDPVTNRALSNNGTEKNDSNTVVGQFNSSLTPDLFNELRVQYSREKRPRLSNTNDVNVGTLIGEEGARNFLPTTQFDWRFQVSNNLTYIVGNHTTKFGVEINHVFVNQTFGFNQFGRFQLNSTSVSNAAGVIQILDLISGGATGRPYDDPTRGRFVQQIGNLLAEYSTDEFALFGQDSWRIRPNFTLNYGLRWEAQFLPQPQATNDPLVNLVRNYRSPIGNGLGVDPTNFPDLTNQIAPRVGFAWDPTGSGKTVVRVNTGIYFARTPGLLLAGPFNNFRTPPGDLSVTLPFALPSSWTPTAGCPSRTACDSLYEQLTLIGYNFNNKRPLSPTDIANIAQIAGVAFNPQLLPGIAPIALANDFKNPKSFQVSGGVERELFNGFSIGFDINYVNTVYLQRNRELNLPAPTSLAGDTVGRPYFGVASGARLRPLTQLSSLQLRESTARSVYRAGVVRANLQRKWGQFSAFYTLSDNRSDDDNERDAGGVQYVNTYDLRSEYNYSNLDQRHQFLANAVFFLPMGFEVAGSARVTSARPLNTTVGSDLNGDSVNNDRPYGAPGQEFKRNQFRNRSFKTVDARVQKRFRFSEDTNLTFSAEFFNLFNFSNIQFAGSQVTNYCSGGNLLLCGLSGPTNVNFRSLIDNNPTSSRRGQLLLNNSPGSIFQVQLGARFQF